MYEFPGYLKYSEEHMWVEVEDDAVRVGLSDFAQSELGEIVSLHLPDAGEECERSTTVGEIEAFNNPVFEIVAPLSGSIVEVNTDLYDAPRSVNEDPYGDGWLFLIKPSDDSELKTLLASKEYREKVEREGELL